jgi:ArsR family transcriptional regulator, arsenate/arsenite/antimonite-responsive transcriptional repressor
MGIRIRPEGCCSPRSIAPIPEGARDRLVARFKALADPNRLEILRLIAAQPGPVCVCDVVARVPLSQPTVSHHLKVLREAGWLRGWKVGVWTFYEVEGDAASSLRETAELLEGPQPAEEPEPAPA